MKDTVNPNFKIKTTQKDIGGEKDYGKFVFEPLPQGYGHTLGNSLRRCLLNSLKGAAITEVNINDIQHQFSTIEGVKEDVIEILLNLKQIKVSYKGAEKEKMVLKAKGEGEVTAEDFEGSSEIKIINKDFKIASLTDKKSSLEITAWVESGYGYSPTEEREEKKLGIIKVDSIFTPIVKVNYKVEATRVGRRTDYDKLILEVWTDGSITAKEGLEKATKTLTDFFKQIYNPVVEEEEDQEEDTHEENQEVLKFTVEELGLPTRIANALRRGGYGTVKSLTEADKEEIKKVKNIGAKSVDIITEKLEKKGVGFKEE